MCPWCVHTLPNGQYWNQFHHILCRGRWRSSIQSAKTIPELTVAQISSIQFSCSVMSDFLWPHKLQHARPPCPSLTPRVEFTQTHVHWVGDVIQPSHPLLSPSPALNLSQHQGLFQWVSSHQVAKVLEFQLQHQSFQWIFRLISFRMDSLAFLAVQGTLKSILQHHSSKASIHHLSAFIMVQFSHPYMTTGKTIALTRRTFVGKVMSLLFNMLSRFVIAFLPRSKHLINSIEMRNNSMEKWEKNL